MDLTSLFSDLMPYIKPYAIKAAYALGFLIVGILISKIIAGSITRRMLRENPSPKTKRIAGVINSMIVAASSVTLFLMSISIVGINLTMLIGGIGLAIGYAMEEVLGNIFASIMIVTHNHYSVGDIVKISGGVNVLGTIENVTTRTTILKTFDKQRIIIPNLTMIRSPITPYSAKTLARCEGTISIPREMDVNIVRPLITETINKNSATTANEYTTVMLSDYSEGGKLLTYYYYFNPANKDGLGRFKYVSEINQSIHQLFTDNNIHVPYPRRLLETSKLS